MPNKLLGQNFLRNANVIEKIVVAVGVEAGDTIIEVGPGRGELTLPLAKRCAEVGAHLFAVEKDKKLADDLLVEKNKLGIKNFEIMPGDILDLLGSKSFVYKSFKIVGNIPYYLTGHLLRTISELNELPTRCVFMVQKEVAQRLAAKPPNINRLAASVQFWADPKILLAVSRKDFFPQPKVDSAVVVFNRKDQTNIPDAARYYAMVRVLFAQPRKTILNNLIASIEDTTKEGISVQLNALNINPNDRPRTFLSY